MKEEEEEEEEAHKVNTKEEQTTTDLLALTKRFEIDYTIKFRVKEHMVIKEK